ncbi:MAG: hypothetical protein AB7L09_02080 [Nitrospira sp.]
MSKIKYFTAALLIEVNEESIRSGRSRNLHTDLLRKLPQDLRFPVGLNFLHGDFEVRAQVTVGPSADKLQSVWLDMPIETFNRLPELEV